MYPVLVQIGRGAGQQWASDQEDDSAAEAITAVECQFPNGVLDYLLNVQDAYTYAERLHGLMFGEPDREESAAFWESIEGTPQPELDWLVGFADGVCLAVA